MSWVQDLRKPRKASGLNAAINMTTAVALTVLQVLAATELDGWLAIALWAMAARNVLILIMWVAGFVAIAVEVANAGDDQ